MQLGDIIIKKCFKCGKEVLTRIGGSRFYQNIDYNGNGNGQMLDELIIPSCYCNEKRYIISNKITENLLYIKNKE